LRPFCKKLAETKIGARVNVKKIKAKNRKKAYKLPAMTQQQLFTKINGKNRRYSDSTLWDYCS
jgi:hypothetical protein